MFLILQHGKTENIDKVITNIYNYLRYYGITCFEFDTRGITAKEFDNLFLTSKDFDLYSQSKILFDNIHKMLSPFSR